MKLSYPEKLILNTVLVSCKKEAVKDGKELIEIIELLLKETSTDFEAAMSKLKELSAKQKELSPMVAFLVLKHKVYAYRGKAMIDLYKEADAGNADAQFYIGQLFGAVNYHTKAAAQGHALAQFFLGNAYEEGRIGLGQDIGKAKELYKKSADQGISEAQYYLSLIVFKEAKEDVDYKVSAELVRKAAEQGHLRAQVRLAALLHEGGKGVEQDKKLAFEWFRKAAEQGDSKSQCVVGSYYSNGAYDVKQDSELAIYWFKKASEQGYTSATALLARELEEVKRREEQAKEDAKEDAENKLKVEALKKAGEHGDKDAWYSLAMMVLDGTIEEENDQVVFGWMRKAAELGHEEAQQMVLVMDAAKQEVLNQNPAADANNDAENIRKVHGAKV